MSWTILKIVNHFVALRVSQEDEQIGLNVAEHGATTELYDLSDTMEDHILGDMTARVQVDDFTEVGLIAHQYNRVVDAVEEKQNVIEQVNAQKKSLTTKRPKLELTLNRALPN